MPNKTYYIDREKTQPINVSWGWFWKNFTITKDGQVIFQLNGNKEIQAGKTVEVTNLGTLKVKLERKIGIIQELQIILNGKPLVNSPADPYKKVLSASLLLLLIAVLNIIIGSAATASHMQELTDLGIGASSIVVGAIYLILAYLGYYKHVQSAFIIAVCLVVLDFVASIYFAFTAGIHNPSTGFILKAFICVYLVNGYYGVKEIKDEERGGDYREELLDA